MKRKQTKRSEQASGIYSETARTEFISMVWESRRRLKLLRNGERNIWRNVSSGC